MALGLLLPLCALPVYSLPRTRWIVREMILREVGDQTDSRMKCLILQLGNLLFLSLLFPLLIYQIKLSIPTLHAVIIIKAVVLNTGCALGFCVCVLSRDRLFVTPWTGARQTPLSMEFFRQEYWSVLPFPPLGDLPKPGIRPTSPSSPALADGFFTDEPTRKPRILWGALKCPCLGFSWISEVRTFGRWAQVSVLKFPSSSHGYPSCYH